MDCPVSGGVARAERRELAIMTGGDSDVLERVWPLLEAVSASVHHCGPVGAGHAMKALNNLVSAAGFLVAAEAIAVGKEFGLDPANDAPFSALCAQLWSAAAEQRGTGADHTEIARFYGLI